MGTNTATITQLLGQLYEAASGNAWATLPEDLGRFAEDGDVVRLSRAIQTESATRRFGAAPSSFPSVFDIHPVRTISSHAKVGSPRLMPMRRPRMAADPVCKEQSILVQSVELAQLAVVILNSMGEVVEMTRTARTLLLAGDGLTLRGKELRATNPTEHAVFCTLLDEASNAGNDRMRVIADRDVDPSSVDGEGAMLMTRRAPKRPLQIVVTPVRAGELSKQTQGAVMVFLCDPEAVPLSRAPILRRLYGLTPTEGRLADELAAGTELQTAAQHLRLTVHTARFHLKSIFRKVGVNRQNDLVRLVLGLPGTAD